MISIMMMMMILNPRSQNRSGNRPNRPRQERPSNQDRRPSETGLGNWRTNRPAPEEPQAIECMVQLFGLPDNIGLREIHDGFARFGSFTVKRITGDRAVLQFATPDEAAAAVRGSFTVRINAFSITVKPYGRPLENTGALDPWTFSWMGTFDMQLEELLAAVRITQSDLLAINKLYEDLKTVMSRAWPGCRTIPFGSLTTGLGVKTSDADCLILLPRAASSEYALKRSRNFLNDNEHLFTAVQPIYNASTPILKFLYLPTGTHCDVSFKTTLGVQNSRLIRYLLSVDPRLLKIALFLKYWASVHGLTGNGKLSSYALTMMLIFYLQQLPNPILPSVAWLQRDPAVANVVDGWNTGISDDPIHNDNRSSLADLIGAFFKYYAEFHFEMFVVCPYIGRVLYKCDFKDTNELPEEFDLYKANVAAGISSPLKITSALCIQDPFEHSRNVALSASKPFAADLKEFFKFAVDIYEMETDNRFEGFLRKILVDGGPKLTPSKNKSKRKHR